MMVCDRRLRGEDGEEGLLFSEVSIVWSWHSAVHYLLISIHDVYCPAGTAWKHTLSE